jgi:cardiolipin synthase
LHIQFAEPVEKLVGSLAGVCLSTPIEGNSVQILENGAFFDILIEEIASAKRSVHFETFLWKAGLSMRVTGVLCERARAGVTVRVLLDASGTKTMGRDTEQRLRESGCHVTKFHPRRLRNIGVLTNAITARSSCWMVAPPSYAATVSSTAGSARVRTATTGETSALG